MGAVVVAVAAAAAGYGATAGAVAMGLAAAGSFAAMAIGAAASLAATLVGGALLGGAKKASDIGAAATDRKLTLKSAIESRKLVYGEVMLSGPLALKTTTGSTKEFLHLVVPMAAHKVAEFLEVWFDDTLSTASRILDYNRVKMHSGSILQEADADLVAEVPGWSTAHRGRGIGYIYARLKYNSTAWPNGIKNVKAVVRGKALYDPRLPTVAIASSAAGTPAVITTETAHGLAVGDEIFILGHAHLLAKYYTVLTAPTPYTFTLASQTSGAAVSLASASTGGAISRLRWSNNWALAVLDYLLWLDGLNARWAEIDADYWIAAANVSDEQVALGSASLCTADAATDVITLAEAVPWQTGLQVRVTSTGALPGGLTAATSYAWVRLTPTTGYLATTKENALYGLGVDITSAGTGAHTISAALSCTVDASAGSVTLKDDVPRDDDDTDDAEQDSISPQFGWATGDAVEFFEGTPPAGLALGTPYYWIRLTNASGKLAVSHEAAITGTALALADAGSGLTMARVSQPRYTANGVIDLSEKHADNLDRLRAAAGGVLPYVQGKYRLHGAAATTPTFELTADDLRDTLKVQARPAKRELFNAVRGTFVDPTQLWEPSDLPAVVSEQYAAEDGEQIFKDVEHHFITDCIRGQRVNKIILEAGRQGMTVEFPARLTAGQHSSMSIAPWDVGALTIDQLGWAGKLFRCLAWKIADDQGIDLSLQEYSASSYDWDPSEAAHADTAPNTTLANPWEVAAPTGLTLESGTGVLAIRGDGTVQTRLKCAWTPPADAYVLSGGNIEVQLKRSADASWTTVARVPGSDSEAYLLDVEDGVAYDVRLRAVNVATATSAWILAAGHLVLGKSEPPPPLTGLYRQADSIYWTYDNAPVDLAGYRVRVAGGLTKNWLKGSDWPNAGAIVKERSIGATALGSGVTTIMVKPVDTSGNEAESAVSLTINLGEYAPENLILTTDLKALGFPGTITGGAVNENGNLAANDTGDAYLNDAKAFYLPQPQALYLPLTYVGLSYSWEYVPPSDAVPCSVYVELAVTGDGWALSYRRRGTADVYLGHNDEAYLPNSAGLYLGGPTVWAGFSDGIVIGRERLDFLLEADAGNRQGVVSALTVNIDVPDITESFDDLVILSTGTRVPITKAYRVIDYVGSITFQDDGYGATGVVVLDKDPALGPRLAAVGATQATIDIHNLKGH